MPLYHTVKGSVNYTVVGTPTIVDGVASGFSADDYLQIYYGSFPPSGTHTYEVFCKFKTGNAITGSDQGIIGSIDYGGYSLGFGVNTYGTFQANLRYNKLSDNTVTSVSAYVPNQAVANADMYGNVLYDFDAGTVTLRISTDGQNWTSVTETATDYKSPQTFNWKLGMGRSSTSAVFQGSIDINQTYIKIDGQAWFGVCPVEVKHIDYGTSVGYTKVGIPLIENGVVSGFSADDYLYISNQVDWKQVTDIVFKIRIPSSALGTNSYSHITFCGLSLFTYSGSTKFQYTGFNANGMGDLFINKDLDADTWYWIKYSSDGTTSTASWSTNGINYTAGQSKQTSTITSSPGGITIGKRSTDRIFPGEIDLNQTYIKVNGKLWFYRPSTNYLVKDDKLVFADSGLYLSGPNTYTVQGTPTIVDNVVSNITTTDYTRLPQAPDFSKPFELCLAFSFSEIVSDNKFIFDARGSGFNGLALYISTDNRRITLIIGSGGSSWDVSTALWNTNNKYFDTANTKYYFKVVFTRSSYIGYRKVENEDWEEGITIASTAYATNPATYPRFGSSISWGNPIKGSIYLNETYIKVDDQLWFYGKNYASQNIAPVPGGFTYGNTTTSAIGWVDMRTQVFTPAPSGATLGKDEVSEES